MTQDISHETTGDHRNEIAPAGATDASGEAGDAQRLGRLPGVAVRRQRGKAWWLWVVGLVMVVLAGVAFGLSTFANRYLAQRQASAAAARAERLKDDKGGSSGDHDFGRDKQRLEAQQAALEAGTATALPVPAAASAPAGALPGAAAGTAVPPIAVAPVGAAPAARPQSAPVRSSESRAGTKADEGVLLFARAKVAQDDTESTAKALMKRALEVPVTTAPVLGATRNVLDEQLTPSSVSRAAPVSASLLPDLRYLLKRGTLIPCIGPRIVTTYAGMLSCTLMEDVYSADGSTLLLRKGATAVGEQNKALLQGQARIFALWTEIDDGPVTVNLDSPMTDPLGGSGIDADVDTHFWARFGGSMMVSFIGDAGQALANLTNRNTGGTTVSLSGTTSAAQNLASETLKNTINIPPTGYSDQGTVIYLYVARHVDFRRVYELVKE